MLGILYNLKLIIDNMAQLLQEVWQQVENLLDIGISVIPVRDKDTKLRSGKIKLAKSPYDFWTDYQSSIITKEKLWHDMNAFDTTAIATICGKVSGNLEGIDIDVKHKPGIAALLFKDIQSLLPDIYSRLRVHKTPSKGYHIPYRIIDHEVPASLKISGRISTDDELKIKPKEKVKYFIETRGEGGYLLAPPSMGYSVHINKPIPVFTWDERCALINICLEYNEIIKIEKKYEPTKAESNYYEQNPFDDFNANCDPVLVLTDLGYTEVKHNSKFIWFTRPGGSKNHIHISFNLHKRFYRNFSSNSDLDEKGYSPANLVGKIKFNDDKKQLYRYLVGLGYGKINQKIEQELVKKNKELPPNASAEAQQQKQQHEEIQKEIHPYGVFWEFNDKDKLVISRERLYDVASRLGFRIYRNELVRIIKPFIYEQTQRQFFDTCKDYIHESDGDLYEDICNCYESFLQDSGKFTASRLLLLDESLILNDTRHVSNKFFINCYIEITSSSIKECDYKNLTERLVFYNRVQQREFKNKSGGVYPVFLDYALGGLSNNAIQTIGYLAHEYKDETTGYIIVLIEKVADPKQGGGSGKNLFSQLLSHTTTFISRPGAGAKFDEKFFQSWNGQKIFAINDVDETFNFLFLKDPAAGNILWKRLFKDEMSISAKDTPKLIVNTNYSYDVSDGGLARRIKPLEFTDYFTKEGGVDVVFNKHFTDDWTQEDWNGYDTFIANSIHEWLKSNRKLQTQELSDTTWEKQFIQNHKQTIWDIIQEFWDRWVSMQDVPNDTFRNHLMQFYAENDIIQKYQSSTKNINKALYDYAAKHRIICYINISMRQSSGMEGKGRRFLKRDESPF